MSELPKQRTLPTVSMSDCFAFLARLIVAAMFIYLGSIKVADPVGFLKLLREFQFTDQVLLLNAVAAVLPWLEVFCGMLLLMGIGTRSTAAIFTVLLIAFSALVLHRALGIHGAGGVVFCAISFDCGCGSGEVNVCKKMSQNTLLLACSLFATIKESRWLALKPTLI